MSYNHAAMNVMHRTYCVLTWGCQMNDEDSEQLGLYLEQDGLLPVGSAAEADVVLLNTCSVRRKPEEKVFSKLGELRELKDERPEMVIGVCGCMAQAHAAEIARRAPHVDFIVGPGHAASVPGLLRRTAQRRAEQAGTQAPFTELDLPPRKGSVVSDVPLRLLTRRAGLRMYVPIMYGCDRFCTFCIVPTTRGRERSRPPEEVLAEVKRLAAGGTREVILLGQTVNSYGRHMKDGNTTFAMLLREIGAVQGIERIRYTSPHPCDFTDDLIETMASTRAVCEHVHLPLQAADDDLLRRMRRGYTMLEYRTLLDRLRERIPGIAVTTDIMLGFPGETDAQFRATLDFVREVRFDAAFMFAYSPRPGTRAATMPDQVPYAVKVARLTELIETQNRISAEINAGLVGSDVDVLIEGPSARNPHRMTGLTRTFKTVHVDATEDRTGSPRPGDLVSVRVVEGGLTGLVGQLTGETPLRSGAGDLSASAGERR